jgi:hypothetical protein
MNYFQSIQVNFSIVKSSFSNRLPTRSFCNIGVSEYIFVSAWSFYPVLQGDVLSVVLESSITVSYIPVFDFVYKIFPLSYIFSILSESNICWIMSMDWTPFLIGNDLWSIGFIKFIWSEDEFVGSKLYCLCNKSVSMFILLLPAESKFKDCCI